MEIGRTATMISRRMRIFIVCVTLASTSIPVSCWADQWLTGLTVAQIYTGNVAGEYVQVITTQAIVNPAGCATADSYFVHDPAIVKDALAIVLTAYTMGSALRVYVSSSSSDTSTGRPLNTAVAIG